MGQVYQATDTKLNRQVALKILPEAFATDPDRLARFQREAQVLASLNHPNIAQIHGIEEADDTRALVLELVEGPTLADRISQGPIPVDEALPTAKQIAEALEAAHEQGIIHRDLKPANIKVKDDGTVKVLDFGLAKAMQPDASDPNLSQSPTISLTAAATQMGMVIGTAAYMAPEQAKGKPVDKRADIWAFGVVLYETLTGRRAFVADDASDTLALVLKFEPDWDAIPAETPARIRRVIQTCLDKRPTQRIQAIGDVRLAMEGTFETTVSPSSQTAADPHPFRFWQRPAVAIISLLLVAAVTGLLVWTLRQDASREVTRFTYDLPVGHQLRVFTRGMVAASPDGRQFVYNTEEGLYLRSMDTLEARLLPGTEDTLGVPFFSPDGQSVGYLQGGQVKRLALSGGAPVNVSETEQALSASWASDNTIWLSVREGILRVSANGGIPEVVIPVSADEVFETPQLLPDGDTVLFTLTSTSGGGGDIRWDDARVVAQRLASGERTVLVEGGRDARYVPTGHLVYALGDGLFAVAFDVDNLTVTSGPVSMVEGVVRAETAAAANFAVSDDGTLFYLSGGRQTTSPLVWVDRTGRVDEIQTVPPNEYGTPRLSPGEDRVLVVAEGDLRVYDLTSGRESRITTDGATLYYADWTPSGAEIAYSSSRGSEGPNVWMQPSDGSGEARQLTALDGRVHFDAWAPDGRTFTAHRHDSDSNNQLIVSLDGTDAQVSVWLDREFSDTNAVFSPDGRYVAFVSEQTGQREIYVQPFPGPGGQTPVSVGGGSEPVWAANGEVFYRRPSDYTMMAVDVSTDPELVVGPPTELFTGGSVPPGGGGPRPRYSVTKDGQRFLMSAAALPSDEAGLGAAVSRVNIVLNWTQELLERVPVP